MADQFDQASELEELAIALALQQHRQKVVDKPTITAKGICLHCGEPLNDGKRWCDANCRDDWQKDHPDQ